MSDEFHYVRTCGADGGVDAIEGAAIGLDLESVVKDGLPPFSVALEIIAACCEILDISDEDGEIHGDIASKYVFIDDTGAVSIESFGADRLDTRAPEAEAENTLTDLYGLGYLAFSLFSPTPPTNLPTNDPDEHDDAVIDAVLTINFEGLPEEMVGDVQWFIAKLMSFEPEDRPPAVDAWRTFIAFADACEGPDFIDWCAASLDGEGERRDSAEASRSMVPPDEDPVSEEEDLGGPVMAAGPLKKGMQLGGGSAPKGQATAFWSKDAMKAALAQEEEDDQSEENFRPSVGGGAATSFWSKEQMQAMASGNSQAPRPKRGGGNSRGGNVRSTTFAPASSIPSRSEEPDEPNQDLIPTVNNPSPIAGPVASGPTAAPAAPKAKPAPAPVATTAEPAKSKMPLIAGGIAVLLLFVCMGALAIGGGAYVLSGDDTPATTTSTKKAEPEPVNEEAKVRDTGQEAPDKKKPEPIAPIKPKPTAKPKPKPKARPKPKPKPTNGPARVNFKGLGRGKLTCSGVKKDFDGAISMTFQQYELPVSCIVEIEGKTGSFWVKGSGDISCRPQGPAVSCDKPEVP